MGGKPPSDDVVDVAGSAFGPASAAASGSLSPGAAPSGAARRERRAHKLLGAVEERERPRCDALRMDESGSTALLSLRGVRSGDGGGERMETVAEVDEVAMVAAAVTVSVLGAVAVGGGGGGRTVRTRLGRS